MEPLSPILVLPGSLRRPSYSHSLAAAIRAAIEEREVRCTLWDLRTDPLPLADPDYHHRPHEHPAEEVRRFVEVAQEASGFVLVTPIYHNGVSGVLKNALDLLTIPQLLFKPVGLASHGGARTTQAVEQLRIITRGLLGTAITTQVCTARGDFRAEPDADGYHPLVHEEIAQRVERFSNELIIMARLMPTARRLMTT